MHPPGAIGCRLGHDIFIVDLSKPSMNKLSEVGMYTYKEGKLFCGLTLEETNTIHAIFLQALKRSMAETEKYLVEHGFR